MSIALLAVSLLSTGAAGRPTQHPTVSVARTCFGRALATRDADRRYTVLDGLTGYLERQVERHSDKPEVAVQLRGLLLSVHLEMDHAEAAHVVARELLSKYREAVGATRFKRWFSPTLKACRQSRRKPAFKIYVAAAAELGMEDAASLADSIDINDQDGDGISNREDVCRRFDDRQDSDDDDVPDGCDSCWGYPDDEDEDEDGFPDGCDHCPGKRDLDSDLDDVPDGCDNCVSSYNPMVARPKQDRLYSRRCECEAPPFAECCWQPDEDNDGQGDPCDNTELWKVGTVEDLAGNVLESFEYTDFGELSQWVKWDDHTSQMVVTTFEYDEHRQRTSQTETPLDGTAPPRTTRTFHDEAGRYIGSIKEWETEQQPFHYYDSRDNLIKVTTATDPPEEAVVLERFDRDEQGRLLKQERLNRETSKLEVVLSKKYVKHGDGSREIIIRERLDEHSEKLTIEGYAPDAARCTWVKEYPDYISPPGGEPAGEPLVTRYVYESETLPNGTPVSDWKTTIHPSGKREVRGWRIHGEPYRKGSQRIFESYTTTAPEPRNADKQDWTKRTCDFFPSAGSYETVEERDQTGTVVTYERDPDEPAYALLRRERRPTETGVEVSTQRFRYDDAGRVIHEVVDDGEVRVTNTFDYDFRGRRVFEATANRLGTIERHSEYDAYDRALFAYVVVYAREFAMVLPDWQVGFEGEDDDVRLRAHWWGLYGRDSSCDIESAHLSVRRLAAKGIDDESVSFQETADREYQALWYSMGASQVAVPNETKVDLCGGLEGRLQESKLVIDESEHVGQIMQLLVRGRPASAWLLQIGIRVKPEGEIRAVTCPSLDTLKSYLASFCPNRRKFDVEHALRKISVGD